MTAALAAEDITVRFGGRVALDGVSFVAGTGAILGIIGPNGAGKSTLFDVISGVTRPQQGRVLVAGHDVSHLTAHERARQGLGRSFQDGRLFPSLTVTECIGLALTRHIPVEAPLSVLVGGPLARSQRDHAQQRIDEVLDQMGLQAYADAFVRELSTGTRRMVDLACAVAHQPRVLLLDEPSSGIAQAEVAALSSLIRRLRDDASCTILLIEHDIPLVRSVSDELLVLEAGRVVTQGGPDAVVADPRVIAAYLGTEQAAG